ncbi:hypothetical protein FOZ61_005623 [Perkinsus olseni]|uniref:Uncharacterized protein n=1 Tax=Perkinsus olseni TaxID=32597 RepID=A0A7J6MB96_PEROL|nr:hypothetical protein FOZ61_005623 [Perkinsus olseni]
MSASVFWPITLQGCNSSPSPFPQQSEFARLVEVVSNRWGKDVISNALAITLSRSPRNVGCDDTKANAEGDPNDHSDTCLHDAQLNKIAVACDDKYCGEGRLSKYDDCEYTNSNWGSHGSGYRITIVATSPTS